MNKLLTSSTLNRWVDYINGHDLNDCALSVAFYSFSDLDFGFFCASSLSESESGLPRFLPGRYLLSRLTPDRRGNHFGRYLQTSTAYLLPKFLQKFNNNKKKSGSFAEPMSNVDCRMNVEYGLQNALNCVEKSLQRLPDTCPV